MIFRKIFNKRKNIKSNLTLVALTPAQVQCAKEINGMRKQISHALICGPYGQIFGTEKQCRKYFEAWNPLKELPIFPELFDKAVETNNFIITDYETTKDLVYLLIEVQDNHPDRKRELEKVQEFVMDHEGRN